MGSVVASFPTEEIALQQNIRNGTTGRITQDHGDGSVAVTWSNGARTNINSQWISRSQEESKVEKDKNWSSVSLVFSDSKLNFRGSFSKLGFTNWLWWRLVRPELEKTKVKLPDVDIADNAFGI